MKNDLKNDLVYEVLFPAMGLAALLLQQQAFRRGYDEKGLFVWANPWTALLLALCAGYAAVLLLCTAKRIPEGGSYEVLFPRHRLRGGMGILAGVLLAEDLLYALTPVTGLMKLAGFAAAFAMAAAGVCRIRGSRPIWVLNGIVSVYLVLRLLENYRMWGASAHLEQYAAPMLTGMLLVLYAFHRTEADAGFIRRKKLILSGYGAMFGCFVAMAGGQSVFHLLTLIWIMSGMCSTEVPEP